MFVPGRSPEITYIPREEHRLESHVRLAQDNLTKLMVVKRPTKFRKTVLVGKIFPQEHAIWIDGGIIADEHSLWDLIVENLDLFTASECSSSVKDIVNGELLQKHEILRELDKIA